MSTQKNKFKKKIINRPNPLISIVVSKKEFETLQRISKDYGVSVAQVTRGLMRLSIQLILENKAFDLKNVLRAGVVKQ